MQFFVKLNFIFSYIIWRLICSEKISDFRESVPSAALLKGSINMEEEKRMKTTILISIAMIRVGILYLLLQLTPCRVPTDNQRKKIVYTFYLNSHIL